MPITSAEQKAALLEAGKQEMQSLTWRGVRIAGNAMSTIVLVKGELNEDERAGAELLSGSDGTALRACLARLGYAPENFCALSAVAGNAEATGDAAADAAAEGAAPTPESVAMPGATLPPELFREALEALDPEAVLLLDETAANVLRDAYADALVVIEDFDTAMLKPGLVAHVLGRRVLTLDGFEAALGDKAEKQRMWAYIKQLPPAGAPY